MPHFFQMHFVFEDACEPEPWLLYTLQLCPKLCQNLSREPENLFQCRELFTCNRDVIQ